jgi:arylsulfatase A-like enzyme
MSGRRLGLALAALAVLGAVVWWLRPRREFALPAALRVEQTVVDLSGAPPAGAIVAQRPEAPVRLAGIRPGRNNNPNAGYRTALIAAAPALLRWRTAVPEHASLRFGAGVEPPGDIDPKAPGVRFTVRVDDRRLFSRVLNPQAHRHDRKWDDERIDLGPWAGREVTLEFATNVDGPAGREAGTPGWSGLRIVQAFERDRQPAAAGRPNVLVLLVDTLRADRLGCYGARPSPSPNLDRLAERGLVFEQAIAQAPWTMPSVATLLTGLHARSHGVVAWPFSKPAARPENGSTVLPDVLPTLPAQAALAGITTVGVSANPMVSRTTNLAHGFETFVEFQWDAERDRTARADEVNAAFLRWLRPNRGRRFFGWLHYMDVHEPYWPPAAFRPPAPAGVRPAVARGRLAGIAERVNWASGPPLETAEVQHLRNLYDGGIRFWDAELERLLRGLAALGVGDSTIVVVTADHGEEFQEHGKLTHGPDLYDEVLHVPLVVVGPGVAPGRVREQVQGIDLFPTIAALLGVEAPVGLPGLDVMARREPRPAYSETSLGIVDGKPGKVVSVRTPEWKLIQTPATGRFELYELARDPGEREDRFGTAPEGAALAAELAAWQPPLPPVVAVTEATPKLERELRALGYVE